MHVFNTVPIKNYVISTIKPFLKSLLRFYSPFWLIQRVILFLWRDEYNSKSHLALNLRKTHNSYLNNDMGAMTG